MVYVIDDDVPMCEAIESLFESVDIRTKCFLGAPDFLSYELPDMPSCLLLDVRLKGASGLIVQRQIRDRQVHIPIIFMTAYGDIQMSVTAMKAGAFDFLTKPLRDQDVLDVVATALEADGRRLRAEANRAVLRRQYDALTHRQREVVGWVVSGLADKRIASQMCLSVTTVKIYRREAMRKMQASTVADLVRRAIQLGVHEAATAGATR